MRTFSTITGAFNYIKKHLNTGNELTLNDSIHFGVGKTVYIWFKDAENLNIGLVPNERNQLFTDLKTDEQIKRAISYIFQTDGYLVL